ncbi:unnamed protein product [Durusdinium trenchii]|uniref:Uncharacterized protein n=2 Tax=Durusdinium trenchii TaxID=1381693 RepID=A0ABP0J0D5_9DINO
MAWQLLVVSAAIGVLVVGLVWKAFQWNITDHDYEPLAVVSGGETDTEKGNTQTNEEPLLLRGPPQAVGIITAMWLLAVMHYETMTWQRLVASLPGYLFGTYLVLGFKWKLETGVSWTFAIPHFLWLMAVPFIEIPWYLVVVQTIGAILEAFGLETTNKYEVLGFVTCLAGLFVAWIGAIFTITWQLALFTLPGCLLVMFVGYIAILEGVQSQNPVFFLQKPLMAWCFALPVLHATGLWWLLLLLELMAFLLLAIPCTVTEDFDRLKNFIPIELLVGLATLAGSLAALAMWSSGGWSWASWPSVFRDLWPWELYLMPFTLFVIW